MNPSINIRKFLLIAAVILFIIQLAVILSGNWIKIIVFLITVPLIAIIPILLISSAISTSIILELIGVAVSGQRWSDKKFFRFFILVWILLLFIQTIGIVIGKSHPPFVNS